MARSELRYGSLFSGIGGIDLGMDLAGFECAWQVEIDEHCRRILEKHWPGVPKYKDIYKVKGSEVGAVDLICGGFPCQPVSQAGKRVGVDDERWLWSEFYRLICEIRPRWVVAENVPGLLSANSGRAFAGVLRDLAKSGYDVVWDVFPAGGPGGVGAPHKRTRVFIVGYSKHNGSSRSGNIRGAQTKFERKKEEIKQSSRTSSVANTKGKRHGRRTGKKRRITKRELQQSKQGRSKVGCEVEGRSESHRRKNTKVADTNSSRQQSVRKRESVQKDWQESKHRGGDAGDVANTNKKRLQRSKETRNIESEGQDGEEYIARCNKGAEQWFVEPNVGRVADGVPGRVHRLKGLGNSIVPQIGEEIGKALIRGMK